MRAADAASRDGRGDAGREGRHGASTVGPTRARDGRRSVRRGGASGLGPRAADMAGAARGRGGATALAAPWLGSGRERKR